MKSGTKPIIPNEQSIKRHQNGKPRKAPADKAKGITIIHAMRPNSITHLFFIGSRQGPINATAITKCAKANQSYPYDKKGYCLFIYTIASNAFQSSAPTVVLGLGNQLENKAICVSIPNAVNPLTINAAIKRPSQMRMAFS